MEFVPDSLLGTLCLYNCIWTVFLWLCLCIWFIGRCRSKSLCFHLQKMQEEANYLETEKIAITFPEIRHFVGCRMSLLYRCIQRFKGLESVGCLFHAASRKYSSGRLLARYPLIRWHSCRHGTLRTVFLPVFVPDGSSFLFVAHAADFLRTEKTGTMCKRVFCLYTLLSSRFNPSGSRQLVCKWRVFSVSKMRGYLPEEECPQRNWQAER